MTDENSLPLGDLLKQIVKKAKPAAKAVKGRRLAQQALETKLGKDADRASVASVKVGVVTIETDSAALFQEMEGFHRASLLETFRAAGLNAREIRVRLVAGR
jgi:hypothetical protein